MQDVFSDPACLRILESEGVPLASAAAALAPFISLAAIRKGGFSPPYPSAPAEGALPFRAEEAFGVAESIREAFEAAGVPVPDLAPPEEEGRHPRWLTPRVVTSQLARAEGLR